MRDVVEESRPSIRGVDGKQGTDLLVSLVVPVFNEEESITPFLERINAVIARRRARYELVFVNDGSTDQTRLVLRAARSVCPLRVINLSRNFGKEAALTAGLSEAWGDAVVPLDVDLQDPVELIERFIDEWQSGYDMVYGIRESRQSDTALKRCTAAVFYYLFNKLSRDAIPENVGDFRLMDRRVVDAVLSLPEKNRFMKGMFSWVGFNAKGIPYRREARAAGKTSWNYWKLWNFALDGVIGFSSLPLRIWTYIGALISLFSFFYIATIVTRKVFFGNPVDGWSSLMVTILFFGGVQLISLGIIGEYLGRLFIESKNRPIFLIESVDSVMGEEPLQMGQNRRSTRASAAQVLA